MNRELPIDFEQVVEILTRLSSKNGLTLARLSRQELAPILLYISAALKPGERHSERDATARLDQWKTQYAPMLRSDVVELRRTLIDGHYWMRDPDGRAYELDAAIACHPLLIRLLDERLQLRIAEQMLAAASAREERKKAALQG